MARLRGAPAGAPKFDEPVEEPEPVVRVDDSRWRRLLGSRITVLLLFELLFIAGITVINSDFLAVDNFTVILNNMAPGAIAVVGTVFLLAAGRFDLSVDGVAALGGIVLGKSLISAGMPPVLGILCGLAVGLVVGTVNGALIEKGGLNPLMTTLGTWWATTGMALGITQSETPSGFPDSVTSLAQSTLLGLTLPVWYAAVIGLIGAVVLARTRFGAHVYATGGDREAARLNGVKTARVGLLLYVGAGALAGLAGVLFAARLSSAPPNAFDGLALDVIAGAVIGGASLNGGRGSVIGALLGLFLLNLLGNAAIYVGVSPYWQKAISGTVLLVAVAADAAAERREGGAPRRRGSWSLRRRR